MRVPLRAVRTLARTGAPISHSPLRMAPPRLLRPVQMERTLVNTWSLESKRGVQPSLVQHALQKLRERIAQHQSAWSDGAGAGGGSKQRAGCSGGLGLLSEAALRQLFQQTGLRDVPVLTYVNIKASCYNMARLLCAGLPPPSPPDTTDSPATLHTPCCRTAAR